MKTDGKLYRIGELANLAHVSKRTVDYYTQLGLLTPTRTESNYRCYTDEAFQRLQLIEFYKKERFSLEEIKERLEVLEHPQVSLGEVSQKIDTVEEKMREVEEILLELRPLLSALDEKQCRLLLQKLSIQGVSLSQLLMILLG
ncbi:MerR family transcriptional regulator [Aneurinibacillus tyrosinisolvens]|uniref:MerR family transcriptional regulator n=1 Tax=Aneurinibacillus tyrosinisolvens TaxID=1443435 RepID=UPI00063F1D67|nr:MerR family transcriptional regulator [Aneurinibacillus tyrosinisolvens]